MPVTGRIRVLLFALLAALVASVTAACGGTSTDTGTSVAPLLSAPAAATAVDSGGDTVQCDPQGPIPEYVWDTLDLIDAGDWPPDDAPGTQGGRRFGNYERLLPTVGDDGQSASYQEWDVNRKEPGRSRDAERIITGADGSAWYTADHYESFTRMC
ncbi:MAG: hypothetical protein GX610_18165 [Rhodococcus sp.]|nr:hypothetical protein [Rhodococcus sp. (in: high G+C Gram-positive bacteria)]